MRDRQGQIHWHRLHGLSALGAALAAGALLVALLGLAPSVRAAVSPDPPLGSVVLSDEQSFTRWANAANVRSIRESPDTSAPQIAPVSMKTEDGRPEVYTLLYSWTDGSGVNWLQVRIPMRPNGRTGWVEATALGPPHLITTRLTVDRRHLRATLYRGGHKKIWSSPIGVGKASTPTPAGRFWIRERLRSSDPGGSYGPLAFGTSAYSSLSDWPGGGVIGIHGTDQPQLIPGRPSHGCIRVPNAAIKRLAHLMPIGTPILIR